MSTFKFELFDNYTIDIFAFENVTNTNEIIDLLNQKEQNNEQNNEEEEKEEDLKICLIDSSFIVDILQIQIAANKAIFSQKHNKLHSNSIIKEFIFCFSCSRNFKDGLRRFSIQSTIQNFYLIFFNSNFEQIMKFKQFIKGKEIINLNENQYFDVNLVIKNFKLSNFETLNNQTIKMALINRIATTGI
eukprot:TRINITY_DN2712_c0_g1_i1.p1 TRINITY_DN2712_c0_g1~~TRINITY_DN2712_c0_g1_i1.p1  ORF type:complete len:188 (-),score=80.54 TRINITY_DN2712_c0_g1_i1:76-639(-)